MWRRISLLLIMMVATALALSCSTLQPRSKLPLRKISITKGTVNGIESLTIENSKIKMVLLPEKGSQIISIFDKKNNHEWMYRCPGRIFRKPSYADNYVDCDFSGFEECFPTVGKSEYPDGPWKGIIVPGHGELWTQPWEYEVKNNRVHLWVYGIRFPYRFDKWISLKKNTIHIKYRLVNNGTSDFKGFWAAHCLIAINPDMKVLLPEGTTVYLHNSTYLINKKTYSWPIAKRKDNKDYDLSLVEPETSKNCHKIFTRNLPEGWAGIWNQKSKNLFLFVFSKEKVPSVGIWYNYGYFPFLPEKPCYVLGLEPTTVGAENYSMAEKHGIMKSIPAKGTIEWDLKIIIDNVGSEKDIGKLVYSN